MKKPDACSDCGSTTWVASVVNTDGTRTCAACMIGLTPLLRAGVPIAATPGAMAPKGGER